ncbi:MAG TPA: ABC transporter ATP-binding protein [Thermomicrobiales bacterium]|nr:ABC transporter ATP-binding protein [Thermomicrobiales bacterium]
MTQPAIETNGLTRDFETTRAVDDLSIRVEPGTVFGFLGPNGSGKTTTIRLLLGLLPPTSGAATVLGYDSATCGDQIRARTGALLEHPGLYERLTAEENLEFFARIWRLRRDERERRIRTLLEHLGLWERRKERIGGWSRGMRQKLAIARTLLHHPPLVFLDEPTAGLDPVASAALRRDLAQLARSDGVTVFLTTHNLAEAEKICDSVAVIYHGKLIAAGKTDELLALVGASRVTIATSPLAPETLTQVLRIPGVLSAEYDGGKLNVDLEEPAEPGEIVAVLVRCGARIDEVRPERGTLEDAFLTLVSSQHAD